MPYRNTFNQVFSVEAGIAAAVAAIVVGLTLFAMWRYRAGRDPGRRPSRRHEWSLVEGGYVVALACIATFLVWLSLTNNGKESAADSAKPAVVVKVVGFQWCWRFQYVGSDATVQGTCNAGHDLPTLVVPTGVPVKFEVESNDVVHEFWLPYLDYKLEAFPNHVNSFVATFPQDGRWEGHCAEFCGLYHADMLFWVKAEPPGTYRQWLSAHHGFHLE